MLLSPFNWKDPNADAVGCELLTANSRAVSWRLKPGRQVFKVIPSVRGLFSLSIAFDKDAKVVSALKDEGEALLFLGEDTLRQRDYALRISKLVGFMVKEHASWEQTIRLMSLMSQLPDAWQCHRADGGSTARHEELVVFWTALLSTLRLTFVEEPLRWVDNNGGLTKLAISWTRLVRTIRDTTSSVGDDEANGRPSVIGFRRGSAIHTISDNMEKSIFYSSDEAEVNEHESGRTNPASAASVKSEKPSAKGKRKKKKAKSGKAREPVTLDTLSKKHGVSREQMEKAVQPLQRGARKHLARKRIRKLRKTALTADEQMLKDSWEKIQPNLTDFASLLFRRMLEVDVNLRWKFDFEEDLAQRGNAVDLPAATPDPKDPAYIAPYDSRDPFDWAFLAKCVVKFEHPTQAYVVKRLCPNVTVENKAGVPLDNFVSLHIIDNDSLLQVPAVFNAVVPHEFVPNRDGYTIIAVANAPVTLPDFRLALRVISSPEWPAPLSYTTEFNPHVESGEVRPLQSPGSGYLETNPDGTTTVKYDVLFRYQIQFPSDQLVSMQFAVNPTQIIGAVLKLDLFREEDEGEVASSITAKDCAFLPFIKVDGCETARAASAAVDDKAAKGSKGGRKSEPKSAKGSKGAINVERPPSTADSVASELPPEPKHAKYVVRGRLLEGQVPDLPDKAEGKGKGKQPKAVAPVWKLQIFTEGKALVVPSQSRSEEIEGEQLGWEAVEEGRGTKSTALRSTYLAESAEAGPAGANVERPSTAEAHVARIFDSTLQTEREQQRTAAVRAFEDKRSKLSALERQRLEGRLKGKSAHLARFDELAKRRETRMGAALSKRDDYRRRLIEEAEARVAVDTARTAALAAEMQIRELLDPALASGGGGKKKKK
mmetsp:Transcript_19937/g.59626  ORF Transcript_19937/g.59626 Transcript_19937/m.59626 type:complete len:883 (+) Transcript_19937:369-3017(+)